MRRLSVSVQLSLLAGALVLVGAVIAGGLLVAGFRAAEDQARESAVQIAQTAALSLDRYLEDAGTSLTYLASRGPPPADDEGSCHRHLQERSRLMSEFFRLGYFDVRGRMVCASAQIPEESRPTLDGLAAWDSLPEADGVLVARPVRLETPDTWVSPLLHRLVDADGRFAGAMVGTVDLGRLHRLLGRVSLPRDGVITVTDIGPRRVVARTRNPESWAGRQIPEEFVSPELLRQGGAYRGPGVDGADRIWGYAPVPQADWVVFAGLPLAWVRGPLRRSALVSAALTLGVLALAIILVLLVRHSIVGTVRTLVRQSREAAQGRSDTISVEGPEEIRELAAAFNRTLQDRTRLEARAQEMEKLEALSRLAGGIAHDFRNLLTVITGEASLGLAELEEGHPLRQSLLAIERAANRAAGVTHKLLAFSEQDPEALDPVDLNAEVRDEARLLTLSLLEDHELDLDLARGLPRVRCGKRRLDAILGELVRNARDALPDGGTIRIRTRPADPDPDSEALSGAILEVEDDGEGMPPRVRERVFEPFFSTRSRSRGTGLGMPRVRGLTRQVGGSVEVESAEGRGTLVRVFLPAWVEGEAGEAGEEEPYTSTTLPSTPA